MKNIEKYTNTKAALEAYNSIISKNVPFDVKNVPFDVWLECEYEEPPKQQTLIEAAEAIVNIVPSTPTSVTRNLFRELRLAVEREKAKPVLNFEKYKTNDEAFVAYTKMCDSRECKISHFRYCGNSIKCVLAWLYAEAEKEEAEAEKEESDE